MSLPLSRRIAQAALLVAASATPLVAAGSASASQLVPQGTDLGQGISRLDGVTANSNLKTEAHQLGQALGTTGAVLSGTAVPAAADTTGTAAANTLPQTDKLTDPAQLVDQLGHHDGSTTSANGQLADAAGKVAMLTPLGPLGGLAGGALPGAAPRAMPMMGQAPAMPAMPLSGAGSLPGAPSVSGVDKVVNGDTLSNPVDATGRLAGQIPATSSLAKSLPSQQRLTSAMPDTSHTLGSVPMLGQLTGSLPAAQHLGTLPNTDHLTNGMPDTGDLLQHPAQSADALHLQQLTGQAGESTHRLGGLPDLGSSVTSLLGGVGGTAQHMPSVS
ncbi:hypothetical protein OG455_15555 [Kitasatospora sp. NBC_01287]|uniref:hypothetical protein n=1 Tax=Kitasatospora sp. NBC_01287 TaxID=2903573 RepID=UPI002253CBC4|nr:hypothetical protein [Kitasatospora sp. NBC_01287]MCX4746922.1 hypothetical protein [Kitasatospora sp. NBC_01287]